MLLDIRFNNYREYFQDNRERYDELIDKPIRLLADELVLKLKEYDKNYTDEPRICRPNRDIRYSKNKPFYRVNRWFFLRSSNISDRDYPYANFYFDMGIEGYEYGLGYWTKPIGLRKFREYSMENTKEFHKFIDVYENQDIFKLKDNPYIRVFYPDAKDKENKYLQQRGFSFIASFDNDKYLYSKELVDKIYKNLITIYPLYEYFIKVGDYELK